MTDLPPPGPGCAGCAARDAEIPELRERVARLERLLSRNSEKARTKTLRLPASMTGDGSTAGSIPVDARHCTPSGTSRVTRSKDSILVRWRESGPEVRYRVCLRSPGSRYVLLRIAKKSQVTLREFTHGSQYQVRIVPENIDHRKGPGASITIKAQ